MKPEFAPLFILLCGVPIAAFAWVLYCKRRNDIEANQAGPNFANNHNIDIERVQRFTYYCDGDQYLVNYIPGTRDENGLRRPGRLLYKRQTPDDCYDRRYRERIYNTANIPLNGRTRQPRTDRAWTSRPAEEVDAPPPPYTAVTELAPAYTSTATVNAIPAPAPTYSR